jgi:ABC-type sugar transport system ATPase subunit
MTMGQRIVVLNPGAVQQIGHRSRSITSPRIASWRVSWATHR